ncbi:MAG: hypothetical protein DA328_08720 [Nitrososphaeraceae archaeon]|nr:hypothetical protein [Nitrososphaeraceae archaeon]
MNFYAYSENEIGFDAKTMYENKKLVIDPSIKNFIIVIPNEAHESLNQPKNQLPLANQPYLPQNIEVELGTAILWFNADVGHTHKINLFDDNLQEVFSTNMFDFNFASPVFEPKKLGIYNYEEKDVNDIDTSFIMNGTINVREKDLLENKIDNNTNYISGTFMVPKKFLAVYEKEFKDNGFNVVSTFSYKDIRGGQKGTGPEQTYILWNTKEQNLKIVITVLQKITSTLVYN